MSFCQRHLCLSRSGSFAKLSRGPGWCGHIKGFDRLSLFFPLIRLIIKKGRLGRFDGNVPIPDASLLGLSGHRRLFRPSGDPIGNAQLQWPQLQRDNPCPWVSGGPGMCASSQSAPDVDIAMGRDRSTRVDISNHQGVAFTAEMIPRPEGSPVYPQISSPFDGLRVIGCVARCCWSLACWTPECSGSNLRFGAGGDDLLDCVTIALEGLQEFGEFPTTHGPVPHVEVDGSNR